MASATPIALEARDAAADGRRFSPSAARNRASLRARLIGLLPPGARVLEIASGTGEHAVTFATAMPDVVWSPSERDAVSLASIKAWRIASGCETITEPLVIDAAASDWGLGGVRLFDAVLASNMAHIAPWSAVAGLFAGAARALAPGGRLILYGPFQRGGAHTAPSNAVFDRELRATDPGWGVRDLDDLDALAAAQGLIPAERFSMPANNQLVAWIAGGRRHV